MKLPSTLLSNMSEPAPAKRKSRGMAVLAMMTVAIASLLGVVWGLLRPEPQGPGNQCNNLTPPAVTANPVVRKILKLDQCRACGMG